MKYQSITEITKEKYVYMLLHPAGRDKRIILTGHRVIYSLGIILFCFITGLMLTSGDVLGIFLGGFTVFFLATGLLFQDRWAAERKYKQITGGEKWMRTITFGHNVTLDDNGNTAIYNYSDFVKIDINEKYYLLYLDENKALPVEKSTFVTGDETNFYSWFSDKIKT